VEGKWFQDVDRRYRMSAKEALGDQLVEFLRLSKSSLAAILK
jgi:hypothetical protein